MKIKLTTLFVFLFLSLTLKGQDTLLIGRNDHNFYKELSISLGYNLNFGEPNDENFHQMELRIQSQKYGGRTHGAFTSLNSGFDIGLNTKSLLIGPRVGGILGYGGFFAGTDLAYYSDFENGTLRLIPMIGIGYHQFRISINPHIRLTNKDFEPINRGHANLTIKIFKLKQQILN